MNQAHYLMIMPFILPEMTDNVRKTFENAGSL
jgi:hypothetical protein